ncbi:MAG: hypothetical protein ACOH1E_01325 [Brevundimonas sp.]
MIHPENADAAIDQLMMIVADLGNEAASLAETAVTELVDLRLARLESFGAGIVSVAGAARAILSFRKESRRPLAEDSTSVATGA